MQIHSETAVDRLLSRLETGSVKAIPEGSSVQAKCRSCPVLDSPFLYQEAERAQGLGKGTVPLLSVCEKASVCHRHL